MEDTTFSERVAEDKPFGDRMKELEICNSLKMPDGEYFAVRIDGRGFSALTERHFQKPADFMFLQIMDEVTKAVMVDLDAIYAYTQSDESSFLIPANSQLFGRRAEKITSTAAGLASAVFSKMFIEPVVFDARVVRLPGDGDVLDYFTWRAVDGRKNAISTAAYWKLRREFGRKIASTKLKELNTRDRQDLLGGKAEFFSAVQGSDSERMRFWYGRGFRWESYEKDGWNPKTGESVKAIRREIRAFDVFDRDTQEFALKVQL